MFHRNSKLASRSGGNRTEGGGVGGGGGGGAVGQTADEIAEALPECSPLKESRVNGLSYQGFYLFRGPQTGIDQRCGSSALTAANTSAARHPLMKTSIWTERIEIIATTVVPRGGAYYL